MKIIIDSRPMQHSAFRGLGRYTSSLIENLLALDNKNIYELFFDPNIPIDPSFKKLLKIPHTYGKKQPFFMPPNSTLYTGYWLKKQFSLLKADLIHFTAQIHMPPSIPKNSIITVHDLINLALKEMFYKFEIAFKADVNYTRNMLNRARKIIADSNNTKNDLINILNIKEEMIEVIYLGIEQDFFTEHTEEDMQAVLRKHSLAQDYLIYFGGAEERKNILSLLTAFSYLCQDFPGLRLALITSLNDTVAINKIKAKLKELGIEDKVICIGEVDNKELSILLKKSKLFVMPSLYEGFGLPPLEANASGTPVVSSYAASLKEVLNDAAVFFDPKDIKQMYKSMKEVLKNDTLKNELISKGIKNARNFSWKKCAEKTLKLYEKCYRS